MRWIHIDDILEFREGEYARAVRTIPADLDCLEEHYPSFPIMPHTLLIESMAQTAGLLVGKSFGFTRDIILAKVDRAAFHFISRPGDRLIIEARIRELRDEGAVAECRITCGEREVGSATLIFAVLGDEDAKRLGARGFVFGSGILSKFNLS
ncbi:MAG: beta-hydroxyacyl-ACP dehydratase [Candidatus Aureabacteria bacterium]|nr:beta-hydroxyacyl-ACP dehydratase [Candidatus Auribacterota bacterium]